MNDENKIAKVFINQDRYKWDGYLPEHQLVQVLEFEISYNTAIQCFTACEWIFMSLNHPDNPATDGLTTEMIAEYHKRWPSLSVGDVIEIDGQKFGCDREGWRTIN